VVALAEVRAMRAGKEPGDLFYTTTNDAGRYTLRLSPGTYSVGVTRPGFELAGNPFDISEDRSHDLVLEELMVEAPPSPEVVQWMKEHAIPIARPDAGHGLDDLAPLEAVVGDARIVSLGEATHGTREFFQLKHRILELLATKKGFDVFAIEATMPEGFDVDEYVQTGKGDPTKALAALYFWTWNTDEVLDLIRWMRAFNADPKHTKKLHFYGFDMQSGARAAKVVDAYLKRVDPALEAEVHARLAQLWKTDRPEAGDEGAVKLTLASQSILAAFDANRTAWEKRTSANEWALAKQHAVILSQLADSTARQRAAVRDRSMAENIRWILDHEGPTSKMVVWAHDAHVEKKSEYLDYRPMGECLRELLHEPQITIGFAFDHGSFQAIPKVGDGYGPLRDFTVDKQRPGTLGASLALAGLPIAAFDLRTIPASGAVHDWFVARHPTLETGSVFEEAHPERFTLPMRVTDRFDALVFVEQTTAARPVAGTQTPDAIEIAPANLGFESAGRGIPSQWHARRSETWGYVAAVNDGSAAEGERYASLRRAPGHHYGERAGGLGQTVDAAPFAGKHVTLTASARAALQSADDEAFLTVSASPSKAPPSKTPITTKSWAKLSASLDVPADAKTLASGIVLNGDGEVDADAFVIEAQ
jgi:erythromycin esterase